LKLLQTKKKTIIKRDREIPKRRLEEKNIDNIPKFS